MSEKPITEDITRMCNVCRDLGYIGALADEYYHDSTGSDMADEITTYITELFNAIRDGGGAYFTEDGIRYWRPDWQERKECTLEWVDDNGNVIPNNKGGDDE